MRGSLRFDDALLAGIYVFHLFLKWSTLNFQHHNDPKTHVVDK